MFEHHPDYAKGFSDGFRKALQNPNTRVKHGMLYAPPYLEGFAAGVRSLIGVEGAANPRLGISPPLLQETEHQEVA